MDENTKGAVENAADAVKNAADANRNAANRRATDRTLPYLFMFLLSGLVIVGGFLFLHFDKPDQVVQGAILAAIGTVLAFWFVKLPKGGDDD